jgi:hypothetical protein
MASKKKAPITGVTVNIQARVMLRPGIELELRASTDQLELWSRRGFKELIACQGERCRIESIESGGDEDSYTIRVHFPHNDFRERMSTIFFRYVDQTPS